MPLTDKIPPPTVIMFMIILSWSCQKKNVFTEKIVYNKSTFTSVAVFCLWVLVCVSYLKNAFIFCFVFFLEQCHELHTLQAPLMLIKIQNGRIVVLVFCQRCVDFFKLLHTILNKNGNKTKKKATENHGRVCVRSSSNFYALGTGRLQSVQHAMKSQDYQGILEQNVLLRCEST